MQNLATLYEAYFVAENHWEAALMARFGDDARDARYEARGKGVAGDALSLAYAAKIAAQRAYFAAVESQRKAA